MNAPSRVDVEEIADCPFSLAVESAHLFFPMLENSDGGARIPLRALALPLPGNVAHRVSVRFRRQADTTERGRAHDELAFDWDARSRYLPNFSGVLRFRSETSKTRIILTGSFVPPFGPVGRLFDRTIGRRLAYATARDFVDRLARALEGRWTAERHA